MRRVLIYTVDTDVVVLAIKAAVERTDLGLFIAFGRGSKFRCINVMKLMKFLGKEKARGLPIFHAFTGCDTVSFFAGRGKRSAMKTWLVYKDFTKVLRTLIKHPGVPSDDNLSIIEQYVVYLYDQSSVVTTVNAARLDLFCRKGGPSENIPPTQAALIQHIFDQCVKQTPENKCL